jgi:ribosomal protein S18 acetylase RimI-like enzyme
MGSFQGLDKIENGGYTMGEIKIIEYQPKYAKSIADMWNLSADSWGGTGSLKTEEAILREHENSTNLNVYIAIDKDEVVGYCNFSQYRMDEGALMIPLLNVRPDYHGAKLGKALVLKAVKSTVELGYPRLDLFTWPGNTKAVPLYKKCGFFWEKREDSTHLMNFIPAVLQTEAVRDYFDTLDWYNDSKRIIEVKEDGRNEKGFDYFEYLWEKDEKLLRVEFERKGRGIRLIETEDYLISMEAEAQNLVFGKSYKVIYNIINKTGKELKVDIRGLDNKNIKFSMDQSLVVFNQAKLIGEFYVGEIKSEQDIWKTHPTVGADIKINGKSAVFKLGIAPKFPAKLSMIVPELCQRKKHSQFFIDIENSFNQKTVFQFELPSTEQTTISENIIKVELDPNGRKSISVDYYLKDFCFYSQNVKVKATLDTGEEVSFVKSLGAALRDNSGRFGGETDEAYMICNGPYTLEYSKKHKALIPAYLTKEINEDYETVMMYPKLGKPYSFEFGKKMPDEIRYYNKEDAIILELTYKSDDHKDLSIKSISRLNSNGIIEQHDEISNNGENPTNQEIWLNQVLIHNLYGAVIPYDGQFVHVDDSMAEALSYWEGSKISENWLYSKGDKVSRGLCWNKDYQFHFDKWLITFHHNLGVLNPKSTIKLEPTYMAVGVFEDWKDFRAFALNSPKEDDIHSQDSFQLIVNNRNPFVGDNFKIETKDIKNACFEGIIALESQNKSFESVQRTFEERDNIKEDQVDINVKDQGTIDTLNMKVDFETVEFEKNRVIFTLGSGDIKTEVLRENDMEIYHIDNGLVSIKAAPEYSNALISLQYKGNEWIDSHFPKPGPKSWWNPWVGGIQALPNHGFTTKSSLNQSRKGEHVTIRDNKGNQWQGIKITMIIEDNDKYKGLTLNQYFLLQRGCPVLCHSYEIIQNTGAFLKDVDFTSECFLSPDIDLKKSWIFYKNNGEKIKIKAGKADYFNHVYEPLLFGSGNRKEKLLMATDFSQAMVLASMNNAVIGGFTTHVLSIKDGERCFTPPTFLVFTEEYIDYKPLEDLVKLRF